ncbi:MAG: SpoIIE family protein phosphatase, partial [Alistipes sp.]|nr:SpoIIE family protein phosphatase [Candidatus Minthomonas equi]
MKNSIARKLSLRVSVVLLAAFILLLAGAFYSIISLVRMDAERYAKSLGGIYSDLIIYDAEKANVPIDLSYSDELSYFGEYMCSWYRVDCIFAYVPDLEKGTIKYLSVTWKDSETGEINEDHMVGREEEYTLTEGEKAVWNGGKMFAIEESDTFGRGLFVSTAVNDAFGNRSMTGVVVSVNDLLGSVMNVFALICLALFGIIVLIAVLLYLLIVRMVSKPAQRISERMSEYVAGGKRSVLKLDSDESDEYTMMVDAFNHMTEDMDRYVEDISRLNREQERQKAEMDIAVDIQKNILTSAVASLDHCTVKAVMKPAKNVGGDLYDYLQLDGTRTMIVIADVSGKGIPAALLMAVVLTHFHQLARMGYSPAEILGAVNDSFSQKNTRLMFVTAFVGIYDSETGMLTYANAGHNPPYA